jgi:hypothetical protein
MAYKDPIKNAEYMKKYRQKHKKHLAELDAKNSRRRRAEAPYDIDRFTQELYKQTRDGARKRGIKFTLTKDNFYTLLENSKGKCALSGMNISTHFNCLVKASIDRIDSNKAYTMNNVQVVASIVNKSKNVLSDADYVKMCVNVAKNNGYTVRKK